MSVRTANTPHGSSQWLAPVSSTIGERKMTDILNPGPDDLNHPKVSSLSRNLAVDLGFPSDFIKFIFSNERPPSFDYWVEETERSWACFIPDEYSAAYPLWSTNGDQTLALKSDNDLVFAKGWHDNPDIEFISKSLQDLLTHLMTELYESELSDDEMFEAAKACGYRFIEDFLAFRKKADVLDEAEFTTVYKDFFKNIEAKGRKRWT